MSSSSISGASAYTAFKSLYADQTKNQDTPNGELQNNSVQIAAAQDNGVQINGVQTGSSFSNPSNDNDDASEAPKQILAPLPPGQGTRIDQLV